MSLRDLIRAAISLLVLAICSAAAGAEEDEAAPPAPAPDQAAVTDMADLALEDLLDIRITSAAKKIQPVSEASSAIYVITQEDIRRSGHTSIAEALRLAPGMNVAQGDAHTWAISARGFQSGLANKLLVLIDGRTVYTPLYSGVYWDVQDTLMEDVERIEVIRGPGATVWGANAVNGVINIITKHSKDSLGGMATGSVGTSEHGIGSLRYGGKVGEDVSYRVWAKYVKRDELSLATTETAAHDGIEMLRGGMRWDIKVNEQDAVMLSGDYYGGAHEEKPATAILTAPFVETVTHEGELRGGNFLARWDHSFSTDSNASLQIYYDRAEREEIKLNQALDTIDLDFNHHLKFDRHEIVYGVGYRNVKQDLENSFSVQFDPTVRRTHLYSAFAQDEITILENELSVTLGSKFEHNEFTGFEVQPSAKLLWRPHEDHSVWASVSRAVRTPSPIETDLRANLIAGELAPGVPVLFALFPSKHLPSETVLAYELGYRAQLHKRFSLDVAAYYNQYDNLLSNEAGAPFVEANPPPPHFTVPVVQQPYVEGETYGAEIAAKWNPTDYIHFSFNYTYLQMLLHASDRARAADSEAAEERSPEHQFHARMFVTLPHHLELDTGVYFSDELESLGIPSYVRLDARLGWRPVSMFELSVGAQNLNRKRHEEFAPDGSQIERNLYVKCTLRF
ncbi:MAG: TonB-dependent receptor [Planctomycetes bacterium]|nr:TonB-dependent receptor [Planctomycetota bacterium]